MRREGYVSGREADRLKGPPDWLVRELHYQLDFDGGVEGEFANADGASSVESGIAEHLPEQVGGAVYHGGLAIEAGG
jgi:hypothetical protein